MERALELARIADHRTSPNPMVGAVVVDAAGDLAAEAYHQRAGEAHAERLALDEAGDRAAGGTLYVTLEPCSHQGRTPPCSERVLAAGLGRVVVAMNDPDSRVAGRSVDRLREAGLEVEVGLLEREAEELNEFYVHHRRTGRPYVAAKFAISLDGKIATRGGDSRWITGPEARDHGHKLRHAYDAILVGVNTVIADDPELTARFPGARQPLRVVLDRTRRTPEQAKVNQGEPALFWTRGLSELLDELGRRGILSLLVEGGATVHGAFFDARLVDRVYAYIAPTVIGGRDAPGAVGGEGVGKAAQAFQLQSPRVTRLGTDVLVEGRVHRDR